MTSPADEYSGFTMSSELPPERLGLDKSFGADTPQERRDDEKGNAEDDGDDERLNRDEPLSSTPSGGVENGSGQGGDKVEDLSEHDPGHVYVPDEPMEFLYQISEGHSPGTARWVVVVDGGKVQNATNSRLVPTSNGGANNGLRRYALNPDTNELKDDGFLKKQMFIVVKSSDFKSFAFGVFGVADGPDRQDYAAQLGAQIEDDKSLQGGWTEKSSPWFMEWMGSSSDGNSGDTDPKVELQGNNGGGLTTAEKAGIGVGVGVGSLILIGLAIFFFLRRRKRAATTNKSLTPTNDYMRDKEVHSAQVAETPHSPASDDDNRPRDGAFAAAPAADRSSAVATPSSDQRAVPHSVAHLVEEGMTEDQIRRLEEEERDLDQAIERAGRN